MFIFKLSRIFDTGIKIQVDFISFKRYFIKDEVVLNLLFQKFRCLNFQKYQVILCIKTIFLWYSIYCFIWLIV